MRNRSPSALSTKVRPSRSSWNSCPENSSGRGLCRQSRSSRSRALPPEQSEPAPIAIADAEAPEPVDAPSERFARTTVAAAESRGAMAPRSTPEQAGDESRLEESGCRTPLRSDRGRPRRCLRARSNRASSASEAVPGTTPTGSSPTRTRETGTPGRVSRRR